MKAIMDRILIELRESEAQKNGIFLPETFLNVKNVGRVLSVGKDVKSVKVGDTVLFHAFDELPTINENIVAVRENSILAVMEGYDDGKVENT